MKTKTPYTPPRTRGPVSGMIFARLTDGSDWICPSRSERAVAQTVSKALADTLDPTFPLLVHTSVPAATRSPSGPHDHVVGLEVSTGGEITVLAATIKEDEADFRAWFLPLAARLVEQPTLVQRLVMNGPQCTAPDGWTSPRPPRRHGRNSPKNCAPRKDDRMGHPGAIYRHVRPKGLPLCPHLRGKGKNRNHYFRLDDSLIDDPQLSEETGEDISCQQLAVYVVLARHADAYGWCYAAVETIARGARLSVDLTRRAINGLIERRLVKRIFIPWQSSEYVLQVPRGGPAETGRRGTPRLRFRHAGAGRPPPSRVPGAPREETGDHPHVQASAA